MPIRFGTIKSAADFNLYTFDLEGGQGYAISVTGMGSSGPALSDPILTLLRNGNTLVMDDDSGPGQDPFILYKPANDTQITVRVDGFNTLTGDYRLAVQPDDFRNYIVAPGPAGQLAVGGTREGALQYGQDKDLFAVKLEAGFTYTFSLRGQATGDGTLRDPQLALYDQFGSMLKFDDDSGAGTNARIVYTAEASARFWLEADGFQISKGSYEIRAVEGGSAPTLALAAAEGAVEHDPAHDGLLAAIDGSADFLF